MHQKTWRKRSPALGNALFLLRKGNQGGDEDQLSFFVKSIVFCLLCIALMMPGVQAAESQSAQQNQLNFANGLFQRGFFVEAVEEYEAYLEAADSATVAPEVWYYLGEAAYAAQDYERAVSAFELLQSQPGDSPWKAKARLTQGEVYFFQKIYDQAITVLAPLATPDQPVDTRGRATYYLAKAYFEKGKHADALRIFSSLVEEMPEHPLAPYAGFQLAYTHLAQGELEKAAMQFSAVAGLKADAALRMESRFRAAQTYDQIGWYSAALGAYEQLRAEFPGAPFAEAAGMGFIWALFHEGKCAEAQAAITAHLKRYPKTKELAALEYIRANCLQQTGKNAAAMEAFIQIREAFPDSEFAGRALYKMAWIQYLNDSMEQASDLVTRFLQEYKDSPLVGEGAFLLGTIFVAQGSFEDAQQEFNLVAERYPQSEFGAEALFKSAECLEQLALTDAAAQAFEAFVTKYPDHALTAQAILHAGDARFAASAFEEAVARYTKILENPADPAVEEQVLYRLALTYHNMKDYDRSAATLSTLLEKYPDSSHKEEALFRVAEHTLKIAEKPVKAVALYQALLDAAPEGAYAGRALRGLALSRYAHKDYEEAASLFYRLMTEMPEIALNEETYNWTGQWFYDHEAWEKSARTFELLLEVLPAYPYAEQVRFKIAECSEKAGQHEKALKLYTAMAESSVSSDYATRARWYLAKLHEERGETEDAFRWYKAAANSNSGDIAAKARFQLGVLYEAQEEFGKAARSFMRVAILFLHEEMSPEALWRAGQCYEKVGQPEQARKAYIELLTDFPESPFSAQARDAVSAAGDF